MIVFVGCIAAIVAAGCCWSATFFAVDRLLPQSQVVVRLVGGLCLCYWVLAWGFEVMALTGVFNAWWGILCLVAPCVWLVVRYRGEFRGSLAKGLEELQQELADLIADLRRSPGVAVGLGLVGLHVVVRMARALATPAFGWDDFTYHLFRAGRWVQNGGLTLEPAPDAWTYYEFFPVGRRSGLGLGDGLEKLVMCWYPVAAIGLWCLVLLAAYGVGRELGKDRVSSLVIAAAMAVIPSQVSQMSTAYVDNAVLAMVLVSSLFLLAYLRPTEGGGGQDAVRAGWANALLVGASCGLGLLIKMSFLPLLVPAVVILVWHSWSNRQPREFGAFLVGLVVAAPNLIFNWVMRGSPFYPFEIVGFLPFNEQHSWILNKYGEGATLPELARAGEALMVNLFTLDPFLNIGFLGLALVVLGLWGSVRLARTERGRWFLLWVVVGASLTISSFFSPSNSSMVDWWALMMGRFMVPSMAGLMVVGSLVPAAVLRLVLVPLMVVEYFVYARRGWPIEQTVATVKVAALLCLLVLVGVLLARWRRRWLPLWVSLPLFSGLVLLALVGVREQYRYDAYRLFAERRLLDFHGAPPVSAWPIWQRLDETGPQRVAATAGFDGLTGHNWFRSALLGAWLQNEVRYVPVTTDGRLVSYRDRQALVEVADRSAWLSRLRRQRIDRVVALGPANIEHRWILDLPEVFDLEVTMGNNHFLLARVDPVALTRHLTAVE